MNPDTSLEDALREHKPFSIEEAKKLMKRIDAFYTRLEKSHGGDRFLLYTSTIQGIVHTEGVMTNLRGNMLSSQFAMASALNVLIENVCRDNKKLNRDSVLLHCVTDLAQEVRELWKQPPSISYPKKPHAPPPIGQGNVDSITKPS